MGKLDKQFLNACEKGNFQEVQKLLTNPQINPNFESFFLRRTPFFLACENGHIEVVQLLLNDLRMDINQEDLLGRTALFTACQEGYLEVVELLLNDLRIEINKPDSYNKTPFFIACEKGQIEVVKLLLKDKRVNVNKVERWKGKSPFSNSCARGHIEIVKLLLNDERVELNKVDHNIATPFSNTCWNGHIEIVKLLLNDERIDINKPNKNSDTPFHIACDKGHIKIIEYLLVSGRKINLNSINNNGITAVDIAKNREKEPKSIWEKEEKYQTRKKKFIYIIELLESFESNPNETRKKLRTQLELDGADFFENQNFEEKNDHDLTTYEIEYNSKFYRLKMVVKTLTEFKSAIKSKIEVEEDTKIILEYEENGKMYVLDNLEDLEDGKTIKVSISSSSHPISNSKKQDKLVEYVQLKNWNDVVSLSQGPNLEFRIEIDPDEIPSQMKTQIGEMTEKFSKLETCLRFQATRSNMIFELDFQTRKRAEKAFDEIVLLLE